MVNIFEKKKRHSNFRSFLKSWYLALLLSCGIIVEWNGIIDFHLWICLLSAVCESIVIDWSHWVIGFFCFSERFWKVLSASLWYYWELISTLFYKVLARKEDGCFQNSSSFSCLWKTMPWFYLTSSFPDSVCSWFNAPASTGTTSLGHMTCSEYPAKTAGILSPVSG